jgi:hypothetical protein
MPEFMFVPQTFTRLWTIDIYEMANHLIANHLAPDSGWHDWLWLLHSVSCAMTYCEQFGKTFLPFLEFLG